FGPDRQDYVYEGVTGVAERVEQQGLSSVRVDGLVLRADDAHAIWAVADGWEDLPDVIVGDVALPTVPLDGHRHEL
ncbi:hypothetical protein, partial [Salmonella sp. SAL4456]|uniref:hypothetical protein n=1 Tax=Salmonella sp. SAL4456 TaxID=3159911 RepID=UPI003978AA19